MEELSTEEFPPPEIDQNYKSFPNGRILGSGQFDIRKDELRTLVMADVRHSAKKLKYAFMGQMEAQLTEMMEDVVDSLEKTESSSANSLLISKSILSRDKRKASVAGRLPEKEFRSRPSPLTELLEVPHFKAIHHIFIATLTLFMIHTIVMDLLQTGTIDLGMERLLWAFGKTQTTVTIFLSMNFGALFVLYPAFYWWATYRLECPMASRERLDWIVGGSFVGFMLAFIYIPASIMWRDPLPPASGAAVTMEQCRLLMKMYAFVRSNVPRALSHSKDDRRTDPVHCTKAPNLEAEAETQSSEELYSEAQPDSPNSLKHRNHANTKASAEGIQARQRTLVKRGSWISWDDQESPCPDYSKYLYFLFVPTLIYKDSYPRTSRVDWSYVCWNLAQCVGCIVYANFLISRFCSAIFSNFGHPDHPMSLTQLTHGVFSLMLPGTMCLVLSFFLLLHAWQNAFAEMLRFGDRLFYKDWWNCSSFATYYKTWNILVYDWLYTYVFKDAWESGLGRKYKALPTTLVFLISSLFHEYILSFSFNFFFPVLLVLFGGFGFGFVFVRTRQNAFGNVLLWMALIAGTGIILSAYAAEYYARINCPPPPSSEDTWDFFQPRTFSCGAIKMSFS